MFVGAVAAATGVAHDFFDSAAELLAGIEIDGSDQLTSAAPAASGPMTVSVPLPGLPLPATTACDAGRMSH
jgi:hypothetical protein